MLSGLFPLFVIMTLINPLFNVYGITLLVHLFGRPYTLEALYYGATIAAVFVVMLIWFGCYNAVLTSEKSTSLFGKGIDSFFKETFARILKALQKKDITCVMVSHDVQFCARYADLVSMFFDGQILTTDYPRRFFGKNSFYAAAANRMSHHVFSMAVTGEDIIDLYRQNKEGRP